MANVGSYQSRRVAGVAGGDILFDDFHFSLQKQTTQVENLQKAVGKYEIALKESKACMRNVNECLAEFYEEFWPKHHEYKTALKDSNAVWGILTRYTHELEEPIRRFKKLGDETQKFLQNQDSQLTTGRFQVLNKTNQVGSDDRREKLGNVNKEMVSDMTSLFERRGEFVLEMFKAVYTAHNDFYSESAKISGAILDIVCGLEKAKLEMSVGQGRQRRVVSTNKPRIGWTNAPTAQPPQQPPSLLPKPKRIPTGAISHHSNTPPKAKGPKIADASATEHLKSGAGSGGSRLPVFSGIPIAPTFKPTAGPEFADASGTEDLKSGAGSKHMGSRLPLFTGRPAVAPTFKPIAGPGENAAAVTEEARTYPDDRPTPGVKKAPVSQPCPGTNDDGQGVKRGDPLASEAPIIPNQTGPPPSSDQEHHKLQILHGIKTRAPPPRFQNKTRARHAVAVPPSDRDAISARTAASLPASPPTSQASGGVNGGRGMIVTPSAAAAVSPETPPSSGGGRSDGTPVLPLGGSSPGRRAAGEQSKNGAVSGGMGSIIRDEKTGRVII